MPLGSIMNVARTLWVPRDLALAARTIVEGKVLAMDMGSVGDRYFLEAAGIGLRRRPVRLLRPPRQGWLVDQRGAGSVAFSASAGQSTRHRRVSGVDRSRPCADGECCQRAVRGRRVRGSPRTRVSTTGCSTSSSFDAPVSRACCSTWRWWPVATLATAEERAFAGEPWLRVSRRHGRPLPLHSTAARWGHAGRNAFGTGRTARDHRSAIGTRHSCLGGRRAGRGGNLETARLNLLESAPKTAHPLTNPTFRELWLANIVSNIGTWMQTVGGAWLMTTLTADALPVALMQTATALPGFLVGLPAGSLADRLDRRHLTLATQAWMMACAAILGFLTLAGQVTPWLLLGMTFVLGLGNALAAPTWAAIIPDVVDRPQVPTAISMNSAGYNVARASGPALGGFVVAAVGPAYAFSINAGSFLATLGVVFRWRPRVARVGSASGEPFTSMVLAG